MRTIILLSILVLTTQSLWAQVCNLQLEGGISSEGVVMPEFKEGEAGLNKFVSERLLFPWSDDTLSFEVEVHFVIDKSGRVKNVKTSEAKNEMAANIAEAIVWKMPKWKVGTIEGQPASISCSLTISFDPLILEAYQKLDRNSLSLEGDPMTKMPQFSGGVNSLKKYLSEKIKYPKSAERTMISGTVIVSFIVDSKGNVCYPMILKSVSPELDKEAIWVVSRMPRWDVPKDNVGCWPMTIPVSFRPR